MGRRWRICARKKCSLWTTRSMTSLNEAGGGGEIVPGFCPAAAASFVTALVVEDVSWDSAEIDSAEIDNPSNNNESNLTREIRIRGTFLTLRQLKNYVQNDSGISRLAILHCWLEVNLFRGLDRVVVETVT